MVKTSVIVYGKELQTPISTSYEVSVFGKSEVVIFLKDGCVNLLRFDEQSLNENKSILFVGKDISVVLKSPETIVFTGDVERITFVNPKGDIVSTYKLNECDDKEPFTEIK